MQAGYKDYDTNIANPTEQAYAKYKQQADALYSLLNPYNPEPIKQSRDLAQLQALVTAFNDLGKALGKDIGNSEGLGMVTVDKSNYDNLRKEALKYRDAYNQALQQKGIAEMNRQMQFLQQELANKNANIKGRYQAGQQAKKDFESKNYDQTKSGQTTTNGQSRTRTLIDPNSLENQNEQRMLANKEEQTRISKERNSIARQNLQYKKSKDGADEDLLNGYYQNDFFDPAADDQEGQSLKYDEKNNRIASNQVSTEFVDVFYDELFDYMKNNLWDDKEDEAGKHKPYQEAHTKQQKIHDINRVVTRARGGDRSAYDAYDKANQRVEEKQKKKR
ncbi:MAG: hypothetical protein IJ759_04885 [Bacteroidales bacterium]|nr:hypothetical protein [Bacteroidales bacterium]